ncbi:MAG: AI-2E family transporter, partial [Chitinophagaceae bacterium]
MNENQTPVKLPFYAKLALSLLAILLVFVLMKLGESIIIPLFFSLLIALMLLPLSNWMERHKILRSLAAGLCVLAFIIFISGILFFLGAQLVSFSHDLPELTDKMQAWVHDLQGWIALKFNVDAGRQLQFLNSSADKFANSASILAQGLLLAVG